MKKIKTDIALIFSCTSCRGMAKAGCILLLLSAFALGGCLSKSPMDAQTFAFSAPVLPVTGETAGGRVLGIKTLQVASPFDGRSFVYRTGEFSYERDAYAEFLGLPAEVLVAPVTELLRGDGCFSAVVKMGSAAKPDALIEININELYGDIRKPGNPSAVLAMQVILMDAKNGLTGKVILQRDYSRRIPMKSTAPAALMAAWNQALVEIFADVASDLRSQRMNKSGT
jgi:cholesterol transport system auxiliary component